MYGAVFSKWSIFFWWNCPVGIPLCITQQATYKVFCCQGDGTILSHLCLEHKNCLKYFFCLLCWVIFIPSNKNNHFPNDYFILSCPGLEVTLCQLMQYKYILSDRVMHYFTGYFFIKSWCLHISHAFTLYCAPPMILYCPQRALIIFSPQSLLMYLCATHHLMLYFCFWTYYNREFPLIFWVMKDSVQLLKVMSALFWRRYPFLTT